MPSQLAHLKAASIIVADTGDINAIKAHLPTDATTNPSLLLKAAQQADYQPTLQQAIKTAHAQEPGNTELAQDLFTAQLASQILAIIPGYLSVEVDARLSFDTQATVQRAHQLIERLQKNGVDTQRILIKIAGTWEGIQAAKALEAEGIKCNVTLLFGMAQVMASADARVFLISPFVGRVYDWYLANGHQFTAESDPGVLFVKQAYHYLKARGSDTITMAASFRKAYQILALTGCDRQTISPALLTELAECDDTVSTSIDDNREAFLADSPLKDTPPQLSESQFRWMMNDNPMATEKLSHGIRQFAIDQNALEVILSAKSHA